MVTLEGKICHNQYRGDGDQGSSQYSHYIKKLVNLIGIILVLQKNWNDYTEHFFSLIHLPLRVNSRIAMIICQS